MRFDILTLFPEMIDSVLSESIIGRARDQKIIEINMINIRDYANNKHNRVDDYPYGGGPGMVIQPQPVYDAYIDSCKKSGTKPYLIYLSPQGRVFNQELAKELVAHKHIALLCGHYEGLDERVIEEIVDCEISIGDYVLTGGELAAMTVVDAVSRLVPGVLASDDAVTGESHFNQLLEHPQYTRPPVFKGKSVPDILLTGHHDNIKKWKKLKSLLRTKQKRPDIFEKYVLTDEDKELIVNYVFPEE